MPTLTVPAIGETVTLCTYKDRRTPFVVTGYDGEDMAGRPMLTAVADATDDRYTKGDRAWFSPGQTVEHGDR